MSDDQSLRTLYRVLGSTEDLPEQARSPIAHYELDATHAWNLLNYVGRKV